MKIKLMENDMSTMQLLSLMPDFITHRNCHEASFFPTFRVTHSLKHSSTKREHVMTYTKSSYGGWRALHDYDYMREFSLHNETFFLLLLFNR